MTPFHVTAHLRGPATSLPALDALLAAVIASRQGLVVGFGPMVDIEVPLAREPGGRFHLATFAIAEWEQHEFRYTNKRFPIAEAQMFGEPGLRRINIAHGYAKSFRIPSPVHHAVGDRVEWWAVGDIAAVREILQDVTHLGKKRGVGRGTVASWTVEPCEPWGDGFPVVRDGRALRALPDDWPGLVAPKRARTRLTYPYWEAGGRAVCAVP